MDSIAKQFSLEGKTAVVLAGGGVLGALIAKGYALAGARVVVADLFKEKADTVAEGLKKRDLDASAMEIDVMSQESLEKSRDEILSKYGQIDVLLSGAGGNMPAATTSPENPFFNLSRQAIEKVVSLNLLGGAILPAQVYGREMVKNPEGGNILFVSSMNALRPLTRIAGYSAAKAAVSNFTQWLAVHLNQEHSTKMRVNAIAPGFFLTDQNRFLLTDKETGELTPRGKTILDHTPMGRFGDPEDLVGTAVWLSSDAARFVNGIIVPVDGGFSAFSGV
jgi:NAD(P)-dependent dehydrogenase (short-subunit alcohol dehydrogenase family)